MYRFFLIGIDNATSRWWGSVFIQTYERNSTWKGRLL